MGEKKDKQVKRWMKALERSGKSIPPITKEQHQKVEEILGHAVDTLDELFRNLGKIDARPVNRQPNFPENGLSSLLTLALYDGVQLPDIDQLKSAVDDYKHEKAHDCNLGASSCPICAVRDLLDAYVESRQLMR